MDFMKHKITIVFVTLLVLLLPLASVSATILEPYEDNCESYVWVDHFLVCFLGSADNGNGTSTWTYAVQSDNLTRPPSEALSHWALELCGPPTGYGVIAPLDGSIFVTSLAEFPTPPVVTGARLNIPYRVVLGPDPTTGVDGIKFEDIDDQYPALGEDGAVDVDIFQITLDSDIYETAPVEVEVGAKGGNDFFQTGIILGPSCGPTLITLASLEAKARFGGAMVKWSTAVEVDNAGFNVYRAISAAGPWVKVNGQLLSADGIAGMGANYSIIDKPGTGTYFYVLEDVDLAGKRTVHGPVKVNVGPSFRLPLYRPLPPASR